jgi:predicted amidohydrolase
MAGILVAWLGISLVILNTMPAMPKVRVASVHPNFPLPAHQDPVNTSQVHFTAFAEQAHQAAAQGAKIIYTPEMMFNFDPQVEYTQQFRALAQETNAYLFITYTVSIEGQPWRNESVMLSPDGTFSQVYGKNHTWMIGEPPTPAAGVFPVYDTPLGRLAGLICHDANYTDIARRLTANGAQIIAAPYREFGGFGEQAWTNALFRAVENRTAVVISGAATVSGIINPDGSLVALNTDANGSRVTLVGDVTLGSGRAPYTYLGDILSWASLAGYIGFMIFQSIVEKRAKKPARAVRLHPQNKSKILLSSSKNKIGPNFEFQTNKETKMNEQSKAQITINPTKAALNKRMETIAWGCFLIMLGGFMFVPKSQVHEGLWSISAIMLGLNAARYLNQIRMSGFTTILGIISVIGGLFQLFGVKNLEGAFLLIILSAYLLIKPWVEQRKLFGKAEQG